MVEGEAKYSHRLQVGTKDHRVTFHHLEEIPPLDQEDRIKKIFDAIIKKAAHNMGGKDKIRFHMTCIRWKHDLNMPFMDVNELTGARVLEAFSKIAQSNDNTQLDADYVELDVIYARMPAEGSGWTEYGSCRKRIFLQLERWLQVKRCAITTISNDDLCLARSLVIAMSHHIKQANPSAENITRFKSITDSRKNIQGVEAKQLHLKAGIIQGPCGLPEVKQFQDYLEPFDYKIHVFSADVNFSTVFVGPETCTKRIALLLVNQHYIVLTKLPAFFNTSAFCWDCLKGLNHPERHRCEKKCYYCQDADCKAQLPAGTHMLLCDPCFRWFKTEDCLKRHIENGTCNRLHRCRKCMLQMHMDDDEEHKCGLKECKYCKKMVDRHHLCYMQRPIKKRNNSPVTVHPEEATITNHGTTKRKLAQQTQKNKKSKNSKALTPIVYYYDFEATQDTGIHTPNLVVVQQENGNPEDQIIFKNDMAKNSGDKFCGWVFQERCGHPDAKQPIILVAHYFKGYDGYFVLSYLYRNHLLPHPIFTGSKIMCLDVQPLNIKFIDSINFLPMALCKFPATFGILEMKKGYFPHLFNTMPNQTYIGRMPDSCHYQPDMMTEEGRNEFFKWYNTKVSANYHFNMQEELKSYCASDVAILREGCEKYRALCKEMFYAMDPLLESITIASYCQRVYLQHYMPEDSIAILPHGGYRGIAKQSTKALKWLRWMESRTGHSIQYAGKQHGEARVSISNPQLQIT